MRVILLSSNPEDIPFFQAVAKAAGFSFQRAASPEEVCDELLKDAAALVVADGSSKQLFEAFEKAIVEKIGLFSTVLNSNHMFFVTPDTLSDASFLMASEVFGHYIRRSFKDADIELTSRLFKQVAADRAFGLNHYFNGPTRTQIVEITKSSQKNAVAESLKAHLVKIGFKSRMASIIATAVDELIMNAIFDAPIDELGKQIYAQTPRSTDIALEGKNKVDVRIEFDGNMLGISVIDQFGSLNKKKLLNQHLGASYRKKEYEARSVGGAGAGLGLSNVFRTCGGLIFACETGGKTEVMLFYKKTESFVDFKDQFRFLSTMIYFA